MIGQRTRAGQIDAPREDLSVRLPCQVLDMRVPPGRSLRTRRILTWLRELEREGGTVENVRAVLQPSVGQLGPGSMER